MRKRGPKPYFKFSQMLSWIKNVTEMLENLNISVRKRESLCKN